MVQCGRLWSICGASALTEAARLAAKAGHVGVVVLLLHNGVVWNGPSEPVMEVDSNEQRRPRTKRHAGRTKMNQWKKSSSEFPETISNTSQLEKYPINEKANGHPMTSTTMSTTRSLRLNSNLRSGLGCQPWRRLGRWRRGHPLFKVMSTALSGLRFRLRNFRALPQVADSEPGK